MTIGGFTYRKVLIGFDGSAESLDALRLARALAEPGDWGITVVSVVERDPVGLPVRLDDAEAALQAQRLSAEASPTLKGRRFETHVAAGSPAGVLSELAEKRHADLIVLGSTHRGEHGRVVAGPIAERLLRSAPCPVAVAPRGYARRKHAGLGVVAVGVNASEESERALREADRLANWLDAELRLVAAVPPLAHGQEIYVPVLREHFSEALTAGLASLSTDVDAKSTLLDGEPAAVLADQGIEADLLVLGSRGFGPLRRFVLGGVSAAVMRMAPCPVLVVPRSSGQQQDDDDDG